MKKLLVLAVCVFMLLAGNVSSAAVLIADIPCEKIVDVNTDNDGVYFTKYKIYRQKIGSEVWIMIVSACYPSLTDCYPNLTINRGNDDKKYKGPFYCSIGGFVKNPVYAVESILAHHIKTGDINEQISYVWFASSYTDRFQATETLPVSGLTLNIARLHNMYSSYSNGHLKIWEGDPNV